MTPDGHLVASPAGDLLDAFREVLEPADVHVARRLAALARTGDEVVLLGAALAVRAVRLGSVCVDLDRVVETVADREGQPVVLPWPADLLGPLRTSALVAVGPDAPWAPLRLVGPLLYLDRYWQQEQVVRTELDDRAERRVEADVPALRASLARLFPGAEPGDRQRLAVAAAVLQPVTVLAGGPGTGKTTTVARLLSALADQPGAPLRVALAAPTGKAAARLQESVQEQAAGLGLPVMTASTLHRLLGSRPGSRSRFRHDRDDRLPYDVVVVDETSMVSLTLMSRLLEALRPEARLVLVGDPDQLSSVEAGAVLGDLVERAAPVVAPDPRLEQVVGLDVPLQRGVVRLERVHRFGGVLAELALAVRAGDAEAVLALLRGGDDAVSFVEDGSTTALRADVLTAAAPVAAAAAAGDARGALAGLLAHRLLCAHRRGEAGVEHWAAQVSAWLGSAPAARPPSYDDEEWALGRPVLVTANDHELRLYNGDVGVVVASPDGPRVAFDRPDAPLLLTPARLPPVQTVHAMTVHRSQGSQFGRVSVLLPGADSRVLTRELLYTAVTRAQTHVRVLGTEESVRAALARQVVRASGLRQLLHP